MRKLLRDTLPEIIGGLLLATILGTLTVISGVLGLEENREIFNRVLFLLWYIILLVGTIYVFRAKRESVLQSRTYLPRFSKAAKGLSFLAFMAATGLLIWVFTPYEYPLFVLRVKNEKTENISISNFAEFMVWLDVPVAEDRWITSGRIRLFDKNNNPLPDLITINPGEELLMVGQMIRPERYREYMDTGEIYLAINILNSKGRALNFLETFVTFERKTINSGYIPINVN